MGWTWLWLASALGCLRLAAAPVTITNAVSGPGLVLGTGTFESGTTVTLRAVPQVDWKFDHWEGVPAELATNNPVAFESACSRGQCSWKQPGADGSREARLWRGATTVPQKRRFLPG
jgi:hypothetical protein